MEIRQKIASGLVWSAIRTFGTQLLSCIVFFLLARLLQPRDFGVVAYANIFILLVQALVESGMSTALTQRHELEPLHLNSAFWFNFVLGLFMTLVGIVAAPWIAAAVAVPDLTAILRVVSVIFLINPWILVQNALLQRELHFKAVAIRTIAANLGGGALGVICAFSGLGAWSLVIQIITNTVVSAIALWQLSPWRPRMEFSFPHLRALLSFGLNITGGALLTFVNDRLPQFLIGYFIGPTALGYMNVASRFLEFTRDLIFNTVIPVIFSAFSRLQKDPALLTSQFYGALRLTSLLVFPLFFGLAMVSTPVILSFVGPKWLPAAPLLFLLSFLGLFSIIFSVSGSLIMATGRVGVFLIFGVFTTAVSAVVMFACARQGPYVLLEQRLFLSLLFLPINLWLLQRFTPATWIGYLKQVRLPLLAATGMALVVGLMERWLVPSLGPVAQLAILSSTGALVYSLILHFCSPTLLSELLALSRELRPKKS